MVQCRTAAAISEAISQEDRASAIRQCLPIGPVSANNSDELKAILTAYTTDVQKGEGGHSIRKDRHRSRSRYRGCVQGFSCGKTDQTGCKWHVDYEQAEGDDGPWVLQRFAQPCHVKLKEEGYNLLVPAHELQTSQLTMTAQPGGGGRFFPQGLLEESNLGELLALAGLPAAIIQRVFFTKARRDNIEVTWTYNDIYNTFRRSLEKPDFDASGFVELLARRKYSHAENPSFEMYYIMTDSIGYISRAWVECDGARKIWAQGGRSNVLFMDATFGTNRYGLKLTLFVTVDCGGRTAILAYLLHAEESKEEILWGLRCFHSVFIVPPSAFFTDSGSGLVAAADDFTRPEMPWHTVPHLLCIFHIGKNFHTNLRPLFRGQEKTDRWNDLHNMFWRLAKDSEFYDQQGMVDERQKMIDFISQHGSGETLQTGIAWVRDELFGKAEKWMGAYTWNFFTAGAHSTARSESANAGIKGLIKGNESLVSLHSQLSSYIWQQQVNRNLQRERTMINELSSAAAKTIATPLWLKKVEGRVSKYAYDLLWAQFGQSLAYTSRAAAVDGGEIPEDLKDCDPDLLFCVSRPEDIDRLVHDQRISCDWSEDLAHETGMADTTSFRYTTTDWCSCQYLACYGVPCRHFLHLYMTRPAFADRVGDIFPLFCEKWHTHDAPTLAGMEADLRRRCTHGRQEPLSNQECAALVVPEAAAKPSTCYTAIVNVMRENGVRPILLSPFDLDHRMYTTLERTHLQDDFMKNRLMIKHGHSNQGAWYIAEIRARPAGSIEYNCTLYTSKDNREQPMCLTLTSYIDPSTLMPDQGHKKFTWFIVDLAPLGSDVETLLRDGRLHDPKSLRGLGRPQVKRHKPRYGPTS